MMGAIHHVSRHFRVYAILAYVMAAAERVGQAVLSEGPYYTVRELMTTQFFVNFAEHGFAKRAVVGTLLRPLTGLVPNPELLVFWLMVAISLAALAAVLLLAERFLPQRAGEGADTVAILRCALAIGSLGVMQVVHDLGRFDMLNFAVLIGALVFAVRGRLLLAGVLAVLGVLVHEAFIVYAAPLIIAVSWQRLRRQFAPAVVAMRLLPMVGGLAVVGVAILLYGNSDSAAAVPHGTGGYVWQRGLVEYNGWLTIWQIGVLAAFWAVLGAVVIGIYRGAGRAPDLILLAMACPLALNFLGIDHARWLALGFFVVLVGLGVQIRAFDLRLPDLPLWARRVACLLCLPLGPIGVVEPLNWLY